MDRAVVNELVERVHGFTRAGGAVEAVAVGDAARRLRGWIDHLLGEVAAAMAEVSSVPSRAVDSVLRAGETEARRALRRTETTDTVGLFGAALADGAIQVGHVDALGGGLASLPVALRPQLVAAAEDLVAIAKVTGTDDFRRAVQDEVRRIEADGGEARLERQRRAARCKTWVDRDSGMFRLSASLDPETGLEVDAQLRAVLRAKFAEGVPAGCPEDAVAKQDWLRAHALVDLLRGGGGSLAVDIVAVLDVRDAHGPRGWKGARAGARAGGGTCADARGGGEGGGAVEGGLDGGEPGGGDRDLDGAVLDVGLPVEVPWSVIRRWYDDGASVSPVVLDGGVVLHAPGEMNLGRRSRLASRAQRRVLRVLHDNRCCIPGCSVRFDLAKIHHLVAWEDGGSTDLHNLVPLCQHHHDRVHHDGWVLALQADRSVTVTVPRPPRATGPPA